MRKRIFALVLCISILCTLVPTWTVAADVAEPCDTCGNAVCTCEASLLGRLVKFNTTFPRIWNGTDVNDQKLISATALPAVMKIVAVHVLSDTVTLYELDAAEGYTWPEEYKDYHCVESTKVDLACVICGQFDCAVHLPCEICGAYGCTRIHFYCAICEAYDCGKTHIHCPACGDVDCQKTHIYCHVCGTYDCGIQHPQVKPPVTPVIPDNPDLPADAEVSIVDEHGICVSEAGITLEPGAKTSISAWSGLDSAAYQWQICYDVEKDLWADIYGQRDQGLLLSPAMVMSILADQGTALVRCRIIGGGSVLYSEPVPVSVAGLGAARTADTQAAPQTKGSGSDGELTKVYVVVQFEFSDGRTAAATKVAELIPGDEHNQAYELPVIPGYVASLENASQYQGHAEIKDNTLHINYEEGQLTEDKAFTVVYTPGPVKYTVIHYWQNVDNDSYTEHSRTEKTGTTGEIIDNAHETYDGFYHLLYETPPAAADGSTVVEVYYDRYYYLLTFELGGGYGVDPIYARYGTPVEIPVPTRAGYSFTGWTLEGASADAPAIMPHENREYVAQWKMNDTAKVSVVFWGENPDDEGYSYLNTGTIQVKPGTEYTFNANDTYLICGKENHTHGTACSLVCGKEVHTQHTDACLGNCNHKSHELVCFSAGNYELRQTTKPTQITNFSGDDIYTYTTGNYFYSTIHYYLYLGGTWYCAYSSNGNKRDTTEITKTCTHTHDDSCYSCEYHEHTGSCYSCGMVEHTHSNACNQRGSGLKEDLWKFIKSETVTVNPDGSSVINVHFDRELFTFTFIVNSTEIHRFSAKWGSNIRAKWTFTGSNGTKYSPENKDSWEGDELYTQRIYMVEIMPPQDINFSRASGNNRNNQFYYYTESLQNTAGADKRLFENKYYDLEFPLSNDFGTLYYDEDFFDLKGFDRYKSARENGTEYPLSNNGTTTVSPLYFYYTRHRYNIEFYNPTDLLKTETGVPFEAPLADYNWTPDSSQVPNQYEPGSMKFVGWYLNPECTGKQFDFSQATMPVGEKDGDTTLTLYAKWEPMEYKVNYYLTRESLERDENLPTEMNRLVQDALDKGVISQTPAKDPYTEAFQEDIVLHGHYIPLPSAPGVSEGYENIHPRAGYTLVGWFYLNEEGEETAFDPENIPVTQDLNLYAKWSSNVLCRYNVYFALDNDNNGIPDTDSQGKVIYIADSISGSGIAGRAYTFSAKGGDDLYDLGGDANYRQGYFPAVGSHSITLNIQDTEGTGVNSFTFLYSKTNAVPYTVKYLEEGTNKELHTQKYIADNQNVIVTENFVPISGHMPDAYQKSLVVTPDGKNEIIFWYKEDKVNALYVVNYYIQDLNKGWTQYTFLQSTGTIGTVYDAEAISIDGFTLSDYYTNLYNNQMINGATGKQLPGEVSAMTAVDGENQISGKLTQSGLELNFYYTRNLYPYEFRFMLSGTNTVLADPVRGVAGYDTTVTEAAKTIEIDLDGDGVYEDYQLYDPTETTKSIHISRDGEPLAPGESGKATVNIATFFYVRCTQTMTVTKEVKNLSSHSDPDPDQEFTVQLTIHSKDGYHKNSYSYQKSDGTTGDLFPVIGQPKVLQFTLKHGQTITIEGLPTAEYTVSEVDLPPGYYDTYSPAQTNKLTVNSKLDVTVTNTYQPAGLEISKVVEMVDDSTNIPEVTDFVFTVAVPSGVTGTYSYTVGSETRTVAVTDGKMTVTLKKGETAVFENLPAGSYTVTETDYSAQGYGTSYCVDGSAFTNGSAVTVSLSKRTNCAVQFKNQFPVGDLTIQKTVSKEYFNTVWNGDSFTFTVTRTSRDLIPGNKYDVYLDGEKLSAQAVVTDAKTIVVTINFGQADGETLKTAGKTVTHTLVLKNVPAGTYSVTEAADADYVQTPDGLTVAGLAVPGTGTKAEFTNVLRRPTGNLLLTKYLVKEDDYQGELPADVQFQFTVTLLDLPAGDTNITVVDADTNEVIPVTMVNGSITLTMKADQRLRVQGLPIGRYRITEASIPRYANKFNVDGVDAAVNTDAGGNLYTEVVIETAKERTVVCTNVYPVDKFDLTIQKTGTAAIDENQAYIFRITGPDGFSLDVVILGDSKVTVKDLFAGTYTVQEITQWSWRYTPSEKVQNVELKTADMTVTFENNRSFLYWLSGDSFNGNQFNLFLP